MSMSMSQAMMLGLGVGAEDSSYLNVCQGALQLGIFLGQLVQAVSMLKLQSLHLLHCSLILCLHPARNHCCHHCFGYSDATPVCCNDHQASCTVELKLCNITNVGFAWKHNTCTSGRCRSKGHGDGA